ncbi:hypothetical protein [Nocardioides sp.]|uniref:hypothetical protein n=1 Tax=Nocardioides sp. TaxID=35761 RepID=UPI0035B115BE
MSDSPDLTPEQDAVRRLLADARHDGATPPEVVARLDETLASLTAERSAPAAAGAPVVDLAARRRRIVGTGVLAAAAVVVAGVALGQVLPVGQSSDDAGTSAESSAGGGTEREFGGQQDDAGGDTGDSSAGQELAPQSKTATPDPMASQPTLSSADPQLDQEVAKLRATDAGSSARSSRLEMLELMRSCDLPDLARGRRVAAEVDGQPGLVLFQRPAGAAQDVALYVCGTPDPVRTLTLPAP